MITNSGKAVATAEADSEAKEIILTTRVNMARLRAKAKDIRDESKLKRENDLELETVKFKQALSNLEISKMENLAQIESGKFKKMMDVMG